MKYSSATLLPLMCAFLISCSASRNYSPIKKYPKQELQSDFVLLKNVLESKHPSLYWYTPKDSMDIYFNRYYQAIGDSMTETQFTWHILAPLVDKIHCGHTSVGMSRAYGRWAVGRRFPSFPLFTKVWNDTMAVTGNLNRKDSTFRRGTLITSINGIKNTELIGKVFDYLPEDGHANNLNYIRLSANLPYYHRNIFGLSKNYTVTYIDSTGNSQSTNVPLYQPPRDSTKKDSTKKIVRPKPVKLPREVELARHRSLSFDSTGKIAFMTINTFTKGHLRKFFRKSFRQIKEKNIPNLVLDIRSNGGGRVGISTLLTKYISRKPFRVADSLYAISKSLGPYTRYIEGRFLNNIQLFFGTRKGKDGLYHMRHMERKVHQPKKKRYNGDVYILTNGPTFSAATIFANVVKGQPGILLLGEETGGGWHGNNGIMIPDLTLPNTKTRVRIPLFRLIQYNHVPKDGKGIFPDLYIGTSYDALMKGYDKKLEVVRELIYSKEAASVHGP